MSNEYSHLIEVLWKATRYALAALLIYGLYAVYDESREDQAFADACLQTLIYESAHKNGFWIPAESVQTDTVRGERVVYAAAEKPISSMDDLDEAIEYSDDSLYFLRCSEVKDGTMTIHRVDYLTDDGNWAPFASL